ncbi:MAG: hypothetical protein ACOYEW_02525 [Anaerolineae bacterium]|jgi:cytochrome c oxidase subunit 2
MERSERLWFGFLILVFLSFNALTLSPVVPWQRWMLWDRPQPDRQVTAHFADYRVELSPEATQIRVGEYVEFIATSGDVTYGFGVFRQDGRMILQMQVMPGHENRIMWRFDEPGVYDVRSTEYSGPRHPETFLDDAIVVTG